MSTGTEGERAVGLGVTHPKPPVRHPGPSCHLWVWLGCPRSCHSLSISPSAMHPIRCTLKWGAMGGLQGFPLPEWGMQAAVGADPMAQTAPCRSHGSGAATCPRLPKWQESSLTLLVPHPMSAAPHLSSWGAQEAPNSPQGCPQRGPPAPRRAGVAGRLPQWCRARQTGFMASGRKKLLGKRLSESIDRAAPLPPLCCLPFPHCTLNPILHPALHPSPVGRGSPSPQGTQRGACSVGPSPQKGVRTSGGHRTQGTAL